ncbi:LLM class flavin-dependent oxidoreductase [uncultured Friedmanniella sp.]|uniref:LLM class flavin-dependent oxidoreductase n=1 Tax=uncultured Friedmanniella sp. TaxID=335381 RepID=UPI0035CAF47C
MTLPQAPGAARHQAQRAAGRRLRLGFLTHVEGGADIAESYLNATELFVAADELGFDSGWVAQHHFSDDPTGGLAAPWVFLAHAAARTSRIHLGTGITLASIEDPIRLAEDVAVVETLSGGRVELGVGSGFGESTFRAFGRDHERRRELTTENFARTRAALLGEPIDDVGTVIKAPSPDLVRSRSWHAVFSAGGAAHVADEGSNLLLNRAAYGYEEPTDVVQRPWAEAYLAGWRQRRAPRIGLSRLIFPAADRATSLRHLADGVLDGVRRMSGTRNLGPADLENALFRFNAYYGHPDEITARLQTERVLPVATDLLAQFNPGRPTLDASIHALELIATQIAPELGWTRSSAVPVPA